VRQCKQFSLWSAAFTRIHADSPWVTAGRLKLFDNVRKYGWRSDLNAALQVKWELLEATRPRLTRSGPSLFFVRFCPGAALYWCLSMTPSQKHLAEYVQTGSERAFSELVEAYVGLVYSTALRLVNGDRPAAEDVAQTVFIDLARSARTLSKDVMLGGWLHRHTCFVAATALRAERRRQAREQEAVEMNALHESSRDDFRLIAPVLDEAINELPDEDRTAVVLRFFEQHDFRSVGEQLGCNADAARMRVSRALDRLELLLKRRGVSTTAAGLSVTLVTGIVGAAPAGLGASIITSALAAAPLAGAAGTATATIGQIAAMTTLQKTAIVTVLTAVTGVGLFQAREAFNLRKEKQQLTRQLHRLETDRPGPPVVASPSEEEQQRIQEERRELLRLRNEVAQLRRQLAEQPAQAARAASRPARPAASGGHAPGTYITRDLLNRPGFDTPEAAMESITWAMINGTFDQVNEGLSPDLLNSQSTGEEERQKFEENQKKMAPLFGAIQIVARKVISPDKVELKMRMDVNQPAGQELSPAATGQLLIQPMVKVGEQWKLGGSTREYRESWDSDGAIERFVSDHAD
jgi:RNA polymerase sigma factor (sigma-70 family)